MNAFDAGLTFWKIEMCKKKSKVNQEIIVINGELVNWVNW